mmetsp:Transcript_5530/g.6786  ORF Transcript_5530/g.6786 Transcript_5530/m.6786 type:complete len:147 (-) Transcript_5530:1441-1881(-)
MKQEERNRLTVQYQTAIAIKRTQFYRHTTLILNMNQFFQRVANYVANEILIKGLANSKTFQRFAVRTDAHLRNLKETSNEAINSKLDEIHQTAAKTAFSTSSSAGKSSASRGTYHTSGPPRPPKTGLAGFFEAFGKEIRKDLGIGK